jgi:hypothetical protein
MNGTAIGLYADKADLVMSRAASAIAAARKSNSEGKRDLVENELSVAASYLPRPKNEDAVYANQRIQDAEASDYEKAVRVGDAHQRELSSRWELVVAERQSAKNSIDQKALEFVAERKMVATYALTGLGAVFVVLGAVMMFLGWSRANAAVAILTGSLLIGAVWIFDASWFGWAACGSLLLVGIEGYRRLRHASKSAPQPTQES